MTSYLRAWWFGTTPTSEESNDQPSKTTSTPPDRFPPQTPTSLSPITLSISTPEEVQVAIEDDNDHVNNINDDIPPAFPSMGSIQRSSGSRSKITARSDATLMPPPSLPATFTSLPSESGASSTRKSTPDGASVSSLLLPSSNILGTPSPNTLQLPPSTTRVPTASTKRRGKVALAPGHSPLDWAALKSSGQDLRGTPNLMRVTPSQLKLHNKQDDAWSSFNGKVYNITPYLSFHPGGEKELMRVAGRDGTKLFALTHAWVNVEFMLDECMVGFLVPEPSSAA